MAEKPKPGRILSDLTEPEMKPWTRWIDGKWTNCEQTRKWYEDWQKYMEELRASRDEVDEDDDILIGELGESYEEELERIKASRPLGATSGYEPRSIHTGIRSRRDPNTVSGGLPSLGKKR
jgi:hypothetical protein